MSEENDKSIKDEPVLKELIEGDVPQKTIVTTISKEEKISSKKVDNYYEVLSIWKREKKAEQAMKIILCVGLGGMLVFQVACINIIMFKIGYKKMVFDEWTIRLLVTGVFAEIVAIVKIIVNNLFPETGNKDFMEFLNKFYETQNVEEENKKI